MSRLPESINFPLSQDSTPIHASSLERWFHESTPPLIQNLWIPWSSPDDDINNATASIYDSSLLFHINKTSQPLSNITIVAILLKETPSNQHTAEDAQWPAELAPIASASCCPWNLACQSMYLLVPTRIQTSSLIALPSRNCRSCPFVFYWYTGVQQATWKESLAIPCGTPCRR